MKAARAHHSRRGPDRRRGPEPLSLSRRLASAPAAITAYSGRSRFALSPPDSIGTRNGSAAIASNGSASGHRRMTSASPPMASAPARKATAGSAMCSRRSLKRSSSQLSAAIRTTARASAMIMDAALPRSSRMSSAPLAASAARTPTTQVATSAIRPRFQVDLLGQHDLAVQRVQDEAHPVDAGLGVGAVPPEAVDLEVTQGFGLREHVDGLVVGVDHLDGATRLVLRQAKFDPRGTALRGPEGVRQLDLVDDQLGAGALRDDEDGERRQDDDGEEKRRQEPAAQTHLMQMRSSRTGREAEDSAYPIY